MSKEKKDESEVSLRPGDIELTAHSVGSRGDILSLLKGHPSSKVGGRPFERSVDYVCRLGAKGVVVQDPAQDPDYLAEYLAFYGKLFVPIHRYCRRLHFFKSGPRDKEDALTFIDRVHAQKSDYLGFITLRPIPGAPVGATFLAAPKNPDFACSIENFEVNFGGRTFTVDAIPFMQQDNAVGACAQASIWMALRALRKRSGNSAYDPAQITSAATRYLTVNRTSPGREGLTFPQMMEAVRSSGHQALPLQFISMDPLANERGLEHRKKKIYPYVESGFPTILILQKKDDLEGHAVIAVGHKWNPKPASTDTIRSVLNPAVKAGESTVSVLHAATWTPEFLIHNDNTGPYESLPSVAAEGDSGYGLQDVQFAMVPLPLDIYISAEEAEVRALGLLHMMLHAIQGANNNAPEFDPARASDKLVLRPYLMRRKEFRKWAVEEPRLPEQLKKRYRQLPLPQHVWVFELNLVDGYAEAPQSRSRRVGEILVDPTADNRGGVITVAAHLNVSATFGTSTGGKQLGVFFHRGQWMGDVNVLELIDGDQTYLPRVHP